jgi:hypothetical protein
MRTQAAVPDTELVPYRRVAAADGRVGCRAHVSSEILDEQGQVLDGLIGFAFEILGVDHLEVRIVPPASDVLVNSTGIFRVKPFEAETEDDFEEALNSILRLVPGRLA